jgi:uncharacterized protein YkwD
MSRVRIALVTAAAAIAALAGAPTAQGQTCAGAFALPRAATTAAAASATLCLVNRERTRRGLRALRANPALAAAAREYSRDMVRRHYFAHGDVPDRIFAHDYAAGLHIRLLGENLAWGTGRFGTPALIVDSWMHSPGHRANVLRPGFREAGAGVASGVPVPGLGSPGATYTVDFGTRD